VEFPQQTLLFVSAVAPSDSAASNKKEMELQEGRPNTRDRAMEKEMIKVQLEEKTQAPSRLVCTRN
jgi:hypothetical protein